MTLRSHTVRYGGAFLIGLVSLFITPSISLGAENELTDQAITDQVENELLLAQAVPAATVNVATIDGVVTLTGSVSNLLASERATRIAETVKGVRSVINRIDVRTIGERSDQEIRVSVVQALAADPATESYEVITAVRNGTVTLTGTVDSWQESKLAERVAKGVRGVKKVENQIHVDYQTDRPDSEIAADVKGTLRWNALVDHALIEVTVQDGDVQLSGIVGSAAEKRLATTAAWVAGVRSVDDSELEVERWARDENLRKNKYVVKSADEIRDAIADALVYDPRVAFFDVQVEVTGSLATLRGTVDNLEAKRAAEQVARNTVGVSSVYNRIKVRTEELVSDDEIETSVRRALQHDPYVESYEVTVSVIGGIVSLNGTVDSYFEKAQAEDKASRVYGVAAVNNNLVVEDMYDYYTYDPYVDESSVYDDDLFDFEPSYTLQSDAEIREDVRSELSWSPFVNADEVVVTVDDGVVTLTGTVDSYRERQAAIDNAWEAGATWVDNDLVVSYD